MVEHTYVSQNIPLNMSDCDCTPNGNVVHPRRIYIKPNEIFDEEKYKKLISNSTSNKRKICSPELKRNKEMKLHLIR